MEGSENPRSIRFGVDWAGVAFELANGLIAINSYKEGVAISASRLEVTDVPEVQQIKTPVRDYQALTCGTEALSPLGQAWQGEDFFLKVHGQESRGEAAAKTTVKCRSSRRWKGLRLTCFLALDT